MRECPTCKRIEDDDEEIFCPECGAVLPPKEVFAYYENRFTGEVLKITEEKFDLFKFNPNEWNKISEGRYDTLIALIRASWK